MSRFTNGLADPAVSVVVPAYNQAHYLAETLDSIRAQTFADYEIILVDDGSTDETPAVARRYAGSLRYIYQTNQGLAVARNTGIQAARGRYVALLDSDDVWLPTFLEKMRLLITEMPGAAVYYSGAFCIDESGDLLPQTLGTQQPSPKDMYSKLLRFNFIMPSAVILRKSTVTEVGLFDPAFRRLQDRELWVRLLRQGHTIVGTSECLIRYRLHETSLSTDPDGGRKAVLALVNKHFGDDDGQWQKWSGEKRRAYGGAYRSCALTSLVRQQDWMACATYLTSALQIDPTLALDIDLFYELSLGTEPLGYRGTFRCENVADRIEAVNQMLDDIFRQTEFSSVVFHNVYSTAYYASGLVAYNAHQLGLSRHCIIQAMYHRPGLLLDWRVVATFLKSFLRQSKRKRLGQILAGIRRLLPA